MNQISPINERAIIGDNNPPLIDPEFLASEEKRVRDFADAAGAWLDLGKIDSPEQASRLKDLIDGARGVYKQIDGARKAAKQPYADKAAAVDAAFKTYLLTVENIVAKLKPIQTAWLQSEQIRLAAEQAEARRAAAEQKRLADEAMAAAAERNDVLGMTQAELATKEAAQAEKSANREIKVGVASATGGAKSSGLREQRYVVIDNLNIAFMQVRDEPRVREAIEDALNARVRTAAYGADPVKIPGVTVNVRVSS